MPKLPSQKTVYRLCFLIVFWYLVLLILALCGCAPSEKNTAAGDEYEAYLRAIQKDLPPGP